MSLIPGVRRAWFRGTPCLGACSPNFVGGGTPRAAQAIPRGTGTEHRATGGRWAWRSLLLLLALAVLLLGSACRKSLVRPERLDEGAMRAWIQGNYAPLMGLEQSWRAVYEGDGQRVPFRLDLAWCVDSTRLEILSPFGGQLASLRCRPGGFQAESGRSLGGWLERAAQALDGKALGGLLDQGARLLRGGVGKDVEVDLKDPTLAPLLLVLGQRLPGQLLDGGLCRREQVAPWLWGEWLPPAGARWAARELVFTRGADWWRVHPDNGLVEAAQVGNWTMELDEFQAVDGVWMAGRLRLTERAKAGEEARSLVLQSRERRLHKAGMED
jgi:hypothetical protein